MLLARNYICEDRDGDAFNLARRDIEIPNPQNVQENWGCTQINIVNFKYEWTINNFSFSGVNVGERVVSPPFAVCTDSNRFEWYLQAYPKGQTMSYSNCVSIFLTLNSITHNGVRAKCTFSILNEKRERSIMLELAPNSFYRRKPIGFGRLIDRNLLFNKEKGFLVNDTLTILCEGSLVDSSINIAGDTEPFVSKIPKKSLSKDLTRLFEDRRYCDVIFSVSGNEFHAHKAILAVRSPVFQAMFTHEMEETKENLVIISDMQPEVFEEMLRFIYTGETLNLEQMTDRLFIAADRYALERLKLMCEDVLCTHLCVENSADMLRLADMYSATQLKTKVIEFLSQHMHEVVRTNDWKTMLRTHPLVIAEALQSIFVKQRTV